MTRYTAYWPVLDQDMTRTELIAEATDDLAAMVDRACHVIAGPIEWSLETAGDHVALTATCDVRPVTYATGDSARNERSAA